MFACLLCGIAYGLLTAGPKDKTALKITMVGQALMLPLMVIAGFGPDATTYAQPMWKATDVEGSNGYPRGVDVRGVRRVARGEDESVEQKTISFF